MAIMLTPGSRAGSVGASSGGTMAPANAPTALPLSIAGPILFLSSHAADYCTGSTLVVDGGGTSRAMAQ